MLISLNTNQGIHRIGYDAYNSLYIELINNTNKTMIVIVGSVYRPQKQCEENYIKIGGEIKPLQKNKEAVIV